MLLQSKPAHLRKSDIQEIVNRLCGRETISQVARLATVQVLEREIAETGAQDETKNLAAKTLLRNLLIRMPKESLAAVGNVPLDDKCRQHIAELLDTMSDGEIEKILHNVLTCGESAQRQRSEDARHANDESKLSPKKNPLLVSNKMPKDMTVESGIQ